ncbi:hypothetical protein VW29_19835 [Devosia limi DSM 17137]|uniref:PTS system, nitrogen regulatory IIA component n=1 Tax=Devosia limi DSM 17137 TaxID=1121477 RepID=A0A0F5L1N0_9HYPH|nr:PTS sugar transporter subunit IIA [Devosia limi]KKB76331.1 hypothetical protein VW29_19835 [Devosia limi DSM 17137]SHF72943.1 PTS system, nitrogen regulatory IIA component [Devosia limi DSM 17137]
MTAANCLLSSNVTVGLSARTKEELLQKLSTRAARATGIDENLVLAALNGREQLGSTGVGRGIAIPHAPVPGIAAPFAFLATLDQPVDYDAIDDEPVDIVFLVLSPMGDASSALKVLSFAARSLRSEETLHKVRAARDEAELFNAVQMLSA